MSLPAPTRSGYAPVNGIELAYAVFGEGKPLVLLHGGLQTMDDFGPVLSELAKRYQVIGVDFQAHGRTRPCDRKMSFEAFAGDVAGLIRWLGHERADVAGYSMGGITAIRLGIDHPEVVNRLVVASAPYAYAGWHDYNAEGMRSIGVHMADEMMQTPLYEAYKAVAPDPENFPKLFEQMGSFIGNDYDWSSEVGQIKSPTLLVVADYDAVRISHSTHFFELLGGGKIDGGWAGEGMTPNRFAVIPSATHYTLNTDPRFAQAIVDFLAIEG
ncbi:alpha/beta fold hydrolase [Devosia sediminis]|uniref:Alpha/beta hydrolase n=1 Tax=Devosia sediminis TaxID=2798801 RepID=A0A934MJ24_9HYPH|nr:alpha/beta hydrolase [Devosia sediminis]MBJ3783603.1 alpha/beta hydrolase [Devosia sediminis]